MKDAIAEDKIYPCRFLAKDGVALVRQARRGEPICGLMQRYHKNPMVGSEAATNGDSLQYYEHGEIAHLELASACKRDEWLQSDEEGRGVPVRKHGDYYGGFAKMDGKAGDIIEIFVQCGQVGELIARQGPL